MELCLKSNESGVYILGGGPAGLAVGYFAAKLGLQFTIIEGGPEVGGNCRTLQMGDFLIDTGAHRLHDKDPKVTKEIRQLLGCDLLEVDSPSMIFLKDRYFNFPLDLGNMFNTLDHRNLFKIVVDNILWKRLKAPAENFTDLAVKRYGKTLSELFLLNYSRKLWGVNPRNLCKDVSGGRLRGLNLSLLIRETFLGKVGSPEHLDGNFLYPKYGFGMIVNTMAKSIGVDRIKVGSRVSKLLHDGKRIRRIFYNNNTEIDVSTVVNTLPLPLSVKLLDPQPSSELIAAADAIKYRNIILCVIALKRPFFTQNATIYFPSVEFPFTRIYEPKNRSIHMAPQDQTAIVIELPCFERDPIWSTSDEELFSLVWRPLQNFMALDKSEVIWSRVYKLPFAYPVLEIEAMQYVEKLSAYFSQFENVKSTGRSALFRYVHLHDLIAAGSDMAHELASSINK